MSQTKSQQTFSTRVAELRKGGMRLQDANRTALAEERDRNEKTANETYRRES